MRRFLGASLSALPQAPQRVPLFAPVAQFERLTTNEIPPHFQ